MNSRPLVSVITPFFNSVRFLEEAIESVLAQSYPKWELLLVDDGSTDASSQIARRCADRQRGRVRYLDHEGHLNRGLPASRNLALRNASGEYVALLDSDDAWLPQKLERQIELMRSEPEAALVYGRSEYWNSWSAGSSTESNHVPELGVHIPLDTLVRPPALLILNYPLGQATAPPPSNLMFRRDVLERVGGFEESFSGIYHLYEDQALLAKVYLTESVYVSNECWDRYRQHPDSCVSVLTRQGHYQTARRFFLEWFRTYMVKRAVDDPEVWQAFQMASWPYSGAVNVAPIADGGAGGSGAIEPASYEGCLDVVNCDAISGWAWNARRPETSVTVNLYDDQTLLVTLIANKFRRDLREARKGDGYHAFTCPLPPWLKDGKAHRIRATVVGSGFDLAPTPKVFTYNAE